MDHDATRTTPMNPKQLPMQQKALKAKLEQASLSLEGAKALRFPPEVIQLLEKEKLKKEIHEFALCGY